jgi:hypothetical protein
MSLKCCWIDSVLCFPLWSQNLKFCWGEFASQRTMICGNGICFNTEQRNFRNTYAIRFATHTKTYVTIGVGNPALSFILRNMSRKEKESWRSVKNVSYLDSVRNKDGQRLEKIYLLICIIGSAHSLASCLIWFFMICIIATPYSLASRLIRFLCVHTCFPFTSPRFLCITQGATHLQ